MKIGPVGIAALMSRLAGKLQRQLENLKAEAGCRQLTTDDSLPGRDRRPCRDASFGDEVLTSVVPNGENDFIVKLASSGTLIWAKRFGNRCAGGPWDMAVNGAGAVAMVGTEPGADLGGGPLRGSGFVVKLAPSGEHIWSRALHTSANDMTPWGGDRQHR
jgi:hypothetical protein